MLKVATENLRPKLLNNCPNILVALMYRSWHSDANERPSLFFIKKSSSIIIKTFTQK
jgi:hypothetical protein